MVSVSTVLFLDLDPDLDPTRSTRSRHSEESLGEVHIPSVLVFQSKIVYSIQYTLQLSTSVYASFTFGQFTFHSRAAARSSRTSTYTVLTRPSSFPCSFLRLAANAMTSAAAVEHVWHHG